jgi:hypothetical protein
MTFAWLVSTVPVGCSSDFDARLSGTCCQSLPVFGLKVK